MSVNCLSDTCCDVSIASCFTEICGDQGKVDSSIAAVAIIENDSLPNIGDSVTLSTSMSPVVLTECNYADSLLQWVRDMQFACPSGDKYYHFFKSGVLAKGTRVKATDKFSENGSNYSSPQHLGYETTALLKLEQHYVPNIEFVEGIKTRGSSLSVIYFFKQGAMVIDSDKDYNIYISGSGFEITGTKNEYILGEIDLMETGKVQPPFYFAANQTAFIKELKKSTAFTFGTAVLTGIVEAACGSQGGCKAYTVAAATPWTYTPNVNELVTCGTFELFANCDTESLPSGVSLNPVTGAITSTGNTAGTYKFTQVVKNGCCVKGSYCIIVIVATGIPTPVPTPTPTPTPV